MVITLNMSTDTDQVEVVKPPRGGRRSEMFRALSHRNYRLFWAGAFVSNTGTWMQAVAQGWLVFKLSNSPFWLGLDAFMGMAPGIVLTLAGGVFADLVDRRRLLIYTQIVSGVSALILGVLVATDVVQVWMILALSFVTGACFSLAGPSYQAITYDLVGRQDVANAVGLNSMQFQLSRVLGPVLAGVGFRLFGLAGCFFANALSFVAVIGALAMVRFDAVPDAAVLAPRERGSFLQDLFDGFRYVRRRPSVSMLLIISSVTSLFGAPYLSMTPVFARDIFHLGETGLAMMMGVAGAGAFLGALVITYLGDFKRKGVSVLGGAMAFGLCLVGFALSTHLAVSLIFLFSLGFAIVMSVAVTNTLLQQLVSNEMRGRVMSMFMLSFIGAMPIGNLIAGVVSARFGVPHTLAAGGVIISLFVAVVTVRSSRLRELY